MEREFVETLWWKVSVGPRGGGGGMEEGTVIRRVGNCCSARVNELAVVSVGMLGFYHPLVGIDLLGWVGEKGAFTLGALCLGWNSRKTPTTVLV